eukprot:TRINITY_DN89825_c0_g1_i1.p1 TRINITY_DN89825_c0_g1~~TRINITY_DN89825_c0_g1_i1.p1  ORF type:complete len:411 (-),score=107.04 TRINITY_DN89825_c0_g1_i1:77-1309(-)
MPVQRTTPKGASYWKIASITALAILAALCIAWVLLAASPDQLRASLQGGDLVMVNMALERYKVLARNMSLRLQAAEQAVLELQKHSAAHSVKAEATTCITLQVGKSSSATASASLPSSSFACPSKVDKTNWIGAGSSHGDTFSVSQNGAQVTVGRSDASEGWGMDLKFECCKAARPAAHSSDKKSPAEDKDAPPAAEGDPHSVNAPKEAEKAPPFQADAEGDEKEASEAEAEEEETEEERAKRQAAEEKEQKELIHYDETAKTYRRWRGDFKCADKVPPLPDGESVECEPGFSAPCCSALGWCGRSAAHCKCEMCTDYRNKVRIMFKSMELDTKKRECETITENLGEFKDPEECARAAVDNPECGKKIMYSYSYPNWGCRCCALDTPAADTEKAEWNVYRYEVTEELVEA